MKASIYLVNHQFNHEHNENLRKRDKRLNQSIITGGLPGLVAKGHSYRRQLSYPSLGSYAVIVQQFRPIKVDSVLKIMMFVACQMRKQTIHRHRHMVLSLDAYPYGMYLDRTTKNRMSIANANADVDVWGLHYGILYLEIDVMELSLTTLVGNLKDKFDFEKRVRLALSALHKLPRGDNTDCDSK